MSNFTFNTIHMIGTLGKDADIRTLQNGTKVANLSLATNEIYKSGDEYKKITTWLYVSAFNPTPYQISKMKKGESFYIEGTLRNNSYEKEGNKIFGDEIKASVLKHINVLTSSNNVDKSSNATTEEAISEAVDFVDDNVAF